MAEHSGTAPPDAGAMQDAGPSSSAGDGACPPRAPRHQAPDKHVYVTCFDQPFKLIECELAVLEPFQPRLLLAIKYDPPSIDQYGRKFWRTGMKYAVTFCPWTPAAGAIASDHSPVMSMKTVHMAGRM